MIVEADITWPKLFQHIKGRFDLGDDVVLELYDFEAWIAVGADGVRPQDGAKFRVVRIYVYV